MSLETTTAILGESPKAINNISRSSFEGGSSTDSFTPNSNEKISDENPMPATGFADTLRSEADFFPKNGSRPTVCESKLYIYNPEIVFPPDDRIRVTTNHE
ncbi:MAG: hypothetical protein ACK53X_08810 [Holosporales bacterium]